MNDRSQAVSMDEAETAALKGEPAAIDALWRRHRRWIAAVVLTYKANEDDLEDLLQEIAMTMVSKLDTVRQPGNIRAWLRAVAINTARASARTRRNRPTFRLADYDHGDQNAFSASDMSLMNEDESDLIRQVNALPEMYREPLMLRAIRGMKSVQIAETLEISSAAVDTRIARARRMLRERLTEPGKTASDNHVADSMNQKKKRSVCHD